MAAKNKPKETSRRLKGDGSIQQLPNGKYKAVITIGRVDGKQIRKSVTRNTPKEVIAALNQLKSEHQQGNIAAPSKMTLKELSDLWVKSLRLKTKPKTIDSYEHILEKHIVPSLGNIKVQKLTVTDINNFIQSLHGLGLSPAYIIKIRGNLHSILQKALMDGIVSRNLVSRADTVKMQQSERRALTDLEIPRVLEEARKYDMSPRKTYHHYYLFILLDLATGCRRGELLALRWENVNLEKHTVSIKENFAEVKGRHVLGTPKSKRGIRDISVDAKVLEQLTKELPGDHKTGLVFCLVDGSPIPFTTIERAVKAIMENAGCPGVTIHNIRHTHATHLLSAGYDLKAVAQRLGDDPRTLLSTYAHLLPGKDKEIAGFIGNKLIP